MAKRINSSEIVQPDLLGDLHESMVKTETKTIALSIQLNAVNDILVDIKNNASTIKEGVLNLGKTTTKDLDARAKAQKKANILAKDAIEAEKIKAKLIADYEKLESQREKRLQKRAIQEEKNHSKREKQYNKEIEKAREQDREYVKTSRLLNEMRNRYKDLAISMEKGIKLTRDERNEMRSLSNQIQSTDASLKKIDASVGQHQRNVGNYSSAIGGLRNGLSQLGLSFGVFQLASSAGKSLMEFENSVASFRTIVSDLNDNEFEVYKNEIKSVADVTKRSNTEIAQSFEAIAGLNSEFAKTSEGLGAVSESVSTLSKASGDELATSAESLVGIMNQFDLSANQANRTINVLAAGKAVGASSITQSAEAYKNFGAVAKGANITLEQSQALIQVLGNNSIFGAEAGTKLRGVTLQLQKAQLGYASGTFNINDALEEFKKKLNAKTTASAKDAYATKIFGAENITAGKIISNNTELFNKYTDSVTGTSEAQKAAEINSNTLSNRWDEFTNKLENTITSGDSTTKVISVLKDLLVVLTNNLDTVIKVLLTGVKAWITYRTVMKSLQIAEAFQNWRKLSGGIADVTKNLTAGQSAGQKFGQAMKGIGWTAIIAYVVEFGRELVHVISGMEQAELRAKALEKAVGSALKEGAKFSEDLLNPIKERLKAQNQEIDLLKVSDKLKAKMRLDATKEANEEVKRHIITSRFGISQAKSELDQARARRDRLKSSFSLVSSTLEEARVLGLAEGEVIRIKARYDELSLIQQNLTGFQLELLDSSHDLNVEQQSLTATTDKQAKSVKELNTQLKEQNEYLSNQNDLLHEIDQIKLEQQINDLDLNIEKSKEDALKRAELTGKVELEATRDLINERAILEKKALDDRINYEIDKVTEEYRLKSVEARKSIEDDRLELLAQENLTNDARLKIEADYKLKIEQLNYDDLQRKGDLELEIQKIKLNSANSQIEIEKKKNDEIEATTKELNDKQEEFAEATRVKIEKADDDARKKRFDEIIKWEELITAFFEKQIDKRIALLEKESDAHQKQQDFFRELAENGNINAQQSLAEEAKLQREADAEKEKLEKRKQYLQAVSAFMVSYTNKLEAGKTGTQALTEALAEKAVLESILNTIPAFKEGGTHEGGLMLVNDASGSRFREIIETPDGNLFSPTQRNVVMDAPKGTKIHTQNQWEELQNNMRSNDAFRNSNSLGGNIAGNSFDIAPLVKEMRSLKNLIKNQPDRSHEIEQMVTGILNFKITEKKGNTTRRIKHQYRS